MKKEEDSSKGNDTKRKVDEEAPTPTNAFCEDTSHYWANNGGNSKSKRYLTFVNLEKGQDWASK